MRRPGCQRKWEERIVRETAHTSRTSKSNTLRPSWVHTRSNTVCMPRESRTWPKVEIEQSIDLRVDGIPNDETYKDEQYMQRIAEQVQKLVTTKEFFFF